MSSFKNQKQMDHDPQPIKSVPKKPPRSLLNLINTYLSIIPEDITTARYRESLTFVRDALSKRLLYASPEEIGYYWNWVNKVLEKYNQSFVTDNQEWAMAILHICRYVYDNPTVTPYLNLLTD